MNENASSQNLADGQPESTQSIPIKMKQKPWAMIALFILLLVSSGISVYFVFQNQMLTAKIDSLNFPNVTNNLDNPVKHNPDSISPTVKLNEQPGDDTWTDTKSVSYSESKSVHIQTKGDKVRIVYRNDNEYIVIDELYTFDAIEKATSLSETGYFGSPEFSPNGNYLTYVQTGYEWAWIHILNTKNNEEVLAFDTQAHSGFSNGEEVTYACYSDIRSGNYARVYSVPEFILLWELETEGMWDLDTDGLKVPHKIYCKLLEDDLSIIRFEVKSAQADTLEFHDYDVTTGEVKKTIPLPTTGI